MSKTIHKKNRLTQERVGQLSSLCRELVLSGYSRSVPWYLMAAHSYYDLDKPFIDDSTFDWLAKFMLANWKSIHHLHKHRITEDDLKAGTLLKRDFPKVVQAAAYQVAYLEDIDQLRRKIVAIKYYRRHSLRHRQGFQ